MIYRTQDSKSMNCLSNFRYRLPLKYEALDLGVSYEKLEAGFIKRKIWRKNEFTYSILNTQGRNPMCIHNSVKRIMKDTDNAVTFKRLEGDPSADITITMFQGGGNWSYLGTDCSYNKPSMNIDQCQEPIVIHEFLHALGMIHEHQNPNNNPIKWNKPVVYEAFANAGYDKEMVDNNLFKTMDQNNINGSSFDPESIMIYDIPPEFTLDGYSVRRNLWLSNLDVLWIKRSYMKPLVPGLFINMSSKQNYSSLIILILVCIILIFIVIFMVNNRNKFKKLKL